MNQSLNTSPPAIKPDDYFKLKNYLIEKIARDLEQSPPSFDMRKQVIIESIGIGV